MFLKNIIRTLIPALVLCSQSFAQTAPAASPQSDEQRKAQQELERKAIGLVEDSVKDSDSFKHPENRIRVRAAAASVLWKYDAPRARTLFREAMASLVDMLNNEAGDEPVDAAKLYEGARQLRTEMLQMLAQHDPRLAREFLRSTRLPAQKAGAEVSPDMEMMADMNMAMQIAQTDPKLAAEIVEDNLSKGWPMPDLVSAIREKDQDAAAKLAGDIFAKLRTDKLDSSTEAWQVAVRLLQIATEEPGAEAAAKTAKPLLDQASLRELADMIAVEALRPSPQSAELLSNMSSLMPLIEKYAPSRAAALKRKLPQEPTEKEEPVDPPQPGEEELEKLAPVLENGSADEILAAAVKIPEAMRPGLYQAAATKLIEKGEFDRARQLVSEKITEPTLRKQMLEQVDQAAALYAAANGNTELARKALGSLRTKEERVALLVQLAMTSAAKGQKKVAMELLEEASGLVSQRAKNVGQLGAQLMVARAYAQLDPQRSLTMLEPIVDQLNELLGAATILGGFFVDELVKDDEIMLGPMMMFLTMTSGDILSPYTGDLVALARADFGRTKALAERFQRDEVKIMARMLIAQSILSPQASGDSTGVSPGPKIGAAAPAPATAFIAEHKAP